MKAKLIFCAEQVIQDARSGKWSTINLITEVAYAQFPAMLTSITLFSMWEREETDPNENLVFLTLTQGDEASDAQSVPVNFLGSDAKTTFAPLTVDGLIISGPGTVTFTFKDAEGTELASWQFVANKVE